MYNYGDYFHFPPGARHKCGTEIHHSTLPQSWVDSREQSIRIFFWLCGKICEASLFKIISFFCYLCTHFVIKIFWSFWNIISLFFFSYYGFFFNKGCLMSCSLQIEINIILFNFTNNTILKRRHHGVLEQNLTIKQ